MEASSEGNKEPRNVPVVGEDTEREAVERADVRRLPTEGVSERVSYGAVERLPVEPTAREIEAGVNAQIEYFKECVGLPISTESLDEETQRVLYELHEQRQGWTRALEADARAALQAAFPDVGGSRVHGPL